MSSSSVRRACLFASVARTDLSCEEAMVMAKAIFEDSPDTKESKKRKRTELSPFDDVLATIDAIILPGLESFLFRGVFSLELIDGMAAVSAGLMREAAVWSRFKRDHQPLLRTAIHEVVKITLEIFIKAEFSEATFDRMAETLGPVANFFFDLVAFEQVPHMREALYAQMQQMAVRGKNGYRASHPGEWQEPLQPASPVSAAFLVSVSESMTQLKQRMQRRPSVQGRFNFAWDAHVVAPIVGLSVPALTELMILPIYYVNRGAMDTLGAAGLDSFSPQTLMQLFHNTH